MMKRFRPQPEPAPVPLAPAPVPPEQVKTDVEAAKYLGDACQHLQAELARVIVGQEKVIELVGPGNTFAEALMFTDKPYIINAQSLADTLLLSVGKAAVVGEIARDPRFALRMLAGISRRLHGLVHDVQAYSLHSGMQRVIGYLLHELPEDAEDAAAMTLQGAGAAVATPAAPRRIALPASKATIASRLSLTPEYFSRVLHELEAEGLIRIDKREIEIRDPRRLAGYQPR